MRIAVIGAAGRTGRLAVEQALERGHEVVAIARRPEQIPTGPGRLRAARADVHDADALAAALAGADAVVSALGTGRSRATTDVYSVGARHTVAAMRAHGIARLAVVSGAPAGPRAEQPPLERRLAMPVLERFFGRLYADMRQMESILAASDLAWVALRPPRLLTRPAHGSYRIARSPLRGGRSLTHGDLATALLDALDRPDLAGAGAYVAN